MQRVGQRARLRRLGSLHIRLTAAVSESSRYSLYALCVPVRESYRNQMPKFLTFSGDFSKICAGSVRRKTRAVGVGASRRGAGTRRRCAHLVDRDDLTVGLLHAAQAAHEVPETRTGDDLVLREDLHAVHLALRVILTVLLVGDKSSDNLEEGLPRRQSVDLAHLLRARLKIKERVHRACSAVAGTT